MPYPGPGGQQKVAGEGGSEPLWAKSGHELFFRQGNRFLTAEVQEGPPLSISRPKVLFEGNYERGLATRPDYDISPDGEKFVAVQSAGQSSEPKQLSVVENWLDELKRRAPAGQR